MKAKTIKISLTEKEITGLIEAISLIIGKRISLDYLSYLDLLNLKNKLYL